MASIPTCGQINSSTTNWLMLAKISQHVNTLAITPPIHFLASLMTFTHLSSHSKNLTNPVKHSLLTAAIIPSIMITAIKANPDTGRNVVLSVIKKAVGPQNIPGKNGKNQRDGLRNDSRNASLRISTEMRSNTSLNMKELTTMMMKMIKETEWMR